MIALLCLFGLDLAAGPSWVKQSVPTDADFRGLCAMSDTSAWASGSRGTFARTTDGGQTWHASTVPGAEKLDFRDVEAFGDTTAYLLSIGPGEASRIYKTTDNGKSWMLQFKNPDPAAFYDALAFWDERHGVALGDPVRGRFRLVFTDDGGATWKPLPETRCPVALPGEGAFAASGTCLIARGTTDLWFVTGGSNVARMLHSPDRGQTWTHTEAPLTAGVESAGIFSVGFDPRGQGLAVGGDYRQPDRTGSTAALTTDGKTWRALEGQLPFRSAVAWTGDRWIAVGTSGSNESADGIRWHELDRENYNTVSFASSGAGWAAGPKGRIARYQK